MRAKTCAYLRILTARVLHAALQPRASARARHIYDDKFRAPGNRVAVRAKQNLQRTGVRVSAETLIYAEINAEIRKVYN